MTHLPILHHEEGVRISQDVRNLMSICPPPLTTPDGEVLPYPASFVQRYEDVRAMKQRSPIYIEEELDDSEDYHTTTKFRMLIRCLSSDADLRVIMAAAQHLELVSQYTIKRGENDQLDPAFEIDYYEVLYTLSRHSVMIDDNVERQVYTDITQQERKAIWICLFEAAGYKVSWGNALNIRRTNR